MFGWKFGLGYKLLLLILSDPLKFQDMREEEGHVWEYNPPHPPQCGILISCHGIKSNPQFRGHVRRTFSAILMHDT